MSLDSGTGEKPLIWDTQRGEVEIGWLKEPDRNRVFRKTNVIHSGRLIQGGLCRVAGRASPFLHRSWPLTLFQRGVWLT